MAVFKQIWFSHLSLIEFNDFTMVNLLTRFIFHRILTQVWLACSQITRAQT